jgi:multidrug efflux pump subunit AcrB
MESLQKFIQNIKTFSLTKLSVNNATSVLILSFIIVAFGLISYTRMPKEAFPEIVIPTIYVQTVYSGNSAVDMENLVTRYIERELKSINGIKDIKSNSIQDFSIIIVEFNTDVEVEKALQEVKDAVDKAKKDLPKDLTMEPAIREINFSEIPILTVNLSGNYSLDELRKYGETMEDEMEKMKEVLRVDLKGVMEREVKINLDLNKMKAMQLTFEDVEYAILQENLTLSAGDVLSNGMRRSVRMVGEFKSVKDIEDIIVKSENMNSIYMKDIVAQPIAFDFAEADSYARSDRFPVVSLDVIKKSGENLLDASDKIKLLTEQAKKDKLLPDDLKVQIFNDQSIQIRDTVNNLTNSIISGVILVVLVLLFFMGLRNANFVGVAIPLSMLLGILILDLYGVSLNMVVLFSLILALGMLVDNGIVVVENMYRFVQNGVPRKEAAILATSEVAIPVITSTLTTVAAFIPLIFWPGIMGEFMSYLPITLMITLTASLFVALVVNPVLASWFMYIDVHNEDKKERMKDTRRVLITAAGLFAVALVGLVTGTVWVRNLFLIGGGLTLVNHFLLRPASFAFQDKALPMLEHAYSKFINFALKGYRPWLFTAGTIFLFIFSIGLFSSNAPSVVLFPKAAPQYINVFVEMPIGTDIQVTNKLTQELEIKVEKAIQPYMKAVDAVLTQVGKGTGDPSSPEAGGESSPNKARITVSFVQFDKRGGVDTWEVLEKIRAAVQGYAGVTIIVDKNQDGPPTGKPINLELVGNAKEMEEMLAQATSVVEFINSKNIKGVEELKTDIEIGKPELIIDVNRDAARRFGTSTSAIAMAIRSALFGKEVSKFKSGDDEYKIMVRLDQTLRNDITQLLSQNITFRNPANGRIVQLPISAMADIRYSSTYSAVNHRDTRRTITIFSNVLEGYNANEVVKEIQDAMLDYKLEDGFNLSFTGEQEEQAESMAFLSTAMLVAVAAIFLILVAQFNSIIAPFIIMLTVLFSTIGVFLGYALTGADFVLIMTGVGIISLAGIVVNNAIVLVDYTNILRQRIVEDKGLSSESEVSDADTIAAIAEAGETRLRPVLLTAITTVLGLIPLAIGLNINFITLVTHSDPQIYIGGESVAFWGPLAWTVIYGLTFSTFLTLVVVPVLYLLMEVRMVRFVKGLFGAKKK